MLGLNKLFGYSGYFDIPYVYGGYGGRVGDIKSHTQETDSNLIY